MTTIILLSACWRMEVLGFSVFFSTPSHSVCIYPHPAHVDCFHPIILSVLFRALLSCNSTPLSTFSAAFFLEAAGNFPERMNWTKKTCKQWSASVSDETAVAEVGAHVELLHDAANMDKNNSALLLEALDCKSSFPSLLVSARTCFLSVTIASTPPQQQQPRILRHTTQET